MITPSKSISIQDSILYKMTIILETEFNEIKITDLYEKHQATFHLWTNLFTHSIFVYFRENHTKPS